MLEIALHAGSGHPSLLWVLIPSIATFIAGLVIGRSARSASLFGSAADTVED